MWTTFKVFIEFVTSLLLVYVSVFLALKIRHEGSLTRDQTCTPFIGRQSLNLWTARDVPPFLLSNGCLQVPGTCNLTSQLFKTPF